METKVLDIGEFIKSNDKVDYLSGISPILKKLKIIENMDINFREEFNNGTLITIYNNLLEMPFSVGFLLEFTNIVFRERRYHFSNDNENFGIFRIEYEYHENIIKNLILYSGQTDYSMIYQNDINVNVPKNINEFLYLLKNKNILKYLSWKV